MLDTSLSISIRPSTEADVAAMLEIYSYHIQHGLGPFDIEPLHPEELKRRRKAMLKRRLPHLVAEIGGVVVGYTYAAPFRKRPAYRYTVEHSIYVHKDRQGLGIGRRLLPALIEACTAADCRQMVAVVDSANTPSLRLHDAFGFVRAGVLRSVGFKFGRWTDSVFLQRSLGKADAELPDDVRGGIVQAGD
ncbi:GNAT family N-acetyltransferase [Azospirillum himalayense]|uniref:GNAT family N-acetyltransferase n=1 Tax=Azospirillum himalayense TaxID=654847 RepID=A0ABW0GAR7_9PROT